MHALNIYLRLGSSGKNGSQLSLLVKGKFVISCAVQVDSKSRDTQNRSVWLYHLALTDHLVAFLISHVYLSILTKVCLKVPSSCSTRTRPATLKSLSNHVCLAALSTWDPLCALLRQHTKCHHHKAELPLLNIQTCPSWRWAWSIA